MDNNSIKIFNKYLTAAFLIFLMTGLLVIPVGAYSAKAGNAENYVPGQLYVKYVPGAAKTAGGMSADKLLETFGAVKSEQAFPNSAHRTGTARGKISAIAAGKLESLSRIKLVDFSADLDMEYVARKLSAHPGIEYAEPVYYQHLDVLPDDPFFHPDSVAVGEDVEQRYLDFVNAPGAWDVATGDSSIVIAIIDSGTDWNHPDLNANVWVNPGEAEFPDDGIDNDGNGYEDDIHGWDFYGGTYDDRRVYGDNDPSGVGEPHGTHTAGIAAAVTNNGIGVASLSHNVRYMPVKVGSDSGESLRFGYDGIMYAAENGADIINCSWGALFFSNTAKEVTDAAIALGSIIVASAGNNNSDEDYYPVGYPNVFGVGSVNLDKTKSSFSNYGSYVDVSAPGYVIYSTLFDGQYGNLSGTSMAAPIVSALAGLIKSAHPDWDNDQILAQIAGTSTPVSDDQGYLRGTGYINAEAAMGEPVLYIEVADYTFSDAKYGNNDGLFTMGERIDAAITLRNCGEDVNDLGFNIYSTTHYSSLSAGSRSVGSLAHSKEIVIDDISFVVSDGIPVDAKEYIRIDFEADESVNFEVIDFSANPSYATMSGNKIEVSFDGNGHIGYVNYSTNSKGMPFVARNNTISQDGVFNVPLLFEGGLLFGTGEERISNSVRGDEQMSSEKDFSTSTDVTIENAPDGSEQQGTIVFSDQDAGDASYNVTVTLDIFSYNEAGNDQYVIFSYKFKNNGAETLRNFIPGLFLDFDVPEVTASNDYAFYSKDNDIVVFSEDADGSKDNMYLGVTVAGSIGSPWIIENARNDIPDSTFFGIYNGFSDEEKWRSLSSAKNTGNVEGYGDVSSVVSAESFDILPGEEEQAIFIIGFGIGLAELKLQIENARLKSELIAVAVEDTDVSALPGEFSIKPVYPNPFNGRTNVSYYLPADTELTAVIYDILGRKVETVFTGFETSGEHSFVINGENLSSGIYFLSIKAGSGMHAFRKFTVLK